jgi:hypothetical protein
VKQLHLGLALSDRMLVEPGSSGLNDEEVREEVKDFYVSPPSCCVLGVGQISEFIQGRAGQVCGQLLIGLFGSLTAEDCLEFVAPGSCQKGKITAP